MPDQEKKSNKKAAVQAWLKALPDPTLDNKLLQPPSLWQKFWHNTRLRVGVGVLFIFIVFGLVFIFLFFSAQPTSSKLSDYVPREAWLYVEFDLQSQEWQALIEQAPGLAALLNDFFIKQGLTQGLIDGASSLALASVFDGVDVVWVWLIRTQQPRQLEIYLAANSYIRQAGEQVIVLTTSQKVIKKFNYKKSRPPVVALEENLWSGFIRPDLLAASFSQADEKNIFLRALGGTLATLPKVTNFQVSLTDQQLLVSTFSNAVSDMTAAKLKGDIYLQAINLNKSLTRLETILENLPFADFFWQNFKTSVADKYNINWIVLRDIFDKPANLAMLSKNSAAGFRPSYNAAFEFGHYYIVLELQEDLSLTEISWLKKFFQVLLARQVPTEEEVELPDGSIGYDLVMRPENFEFSLYQDIADSSYLAVSELDMEIIMLPTAGGYILANSSEFLESYLSERESLDLGCGLDQTEKIYLSKNALSSTSWLSDFSQAVVSFGSNGFNVCLGF